MAGDILDGYNPKGEADSALQDLIDSFDALQRPHWHMIGNHCLYNLPRKVRPTQCSTFCEKGKETPKCTRLLLLQHKCLEEGTCCRC